MKQLFPRDSKKAATKADKPKMTVHKRGQIIHSVSLIVFMVIGVYILGRSIAGTPPAPSSNCGARVSTDTYRVPFGPSAPWNIPACYLPQMTGTLADKWVNNEWNYSHGDIYSTDIQVSHDPSNFLMDFGLATNPLQDYAGPVYDAASTSDGATTTKSIRVRVGSTAGTNLTQNETIPWNPDWAPSRGTDHNVAIINSKTGQEWDLWLVATDPNKLLGDDNVSQCLSPQQVNTWVNGVDQVSYTTYNPSTQLCVSGAFEDKDPTTGKDININTYEGNQPGSRGGGLPGYATTTTPQEVQAGEIRHALSTTQMNTMFGPICKGSQLTDGTSFGTICGDAVAPAGQFEGVSLTLGQEVQNPNTYETPGLDAVTRRSETVPEGTRFALNIDDAYINNWIKARGYTGQQAQTAKVFAEALRDYGWIVADTTTYTASFGASGSDNPVTATLWKSLLTNASGKTTDGLDLMEGLIQKNNLYVVALPTNQCADGTTSTYACPASQSLYPQVGPGAHAAMTLPTDTPPTVIISAPANNAQVSSNVNICVQVNASSSSASITNVDLYKNTTLITHDSADNPSTMNPCKGYHSYQLPNLNVNSPVVFTAIVTDSQNLQTRSAPVVVYSGTAKIGDAIPAYPPAPTNDGVNPPPATPASVAITSPANNTTLTGTSVSLASAISNAKCSYSQVQYLNGTASLGTSTTSPTYSLSLSNLAAGSYSITAVATGTSCAKLMSAAVKVTLQAPTAANKPPTVSLSASSTTLPSTGTLTLQSNAADDHGITKVEFYDGTTLIGSPVTAAPYTITIAKPTVGKHSYTAKAYDNGSPVLTTTSAAVAVTVTSVTPPTVTLQPPKLLPSNLNFDGFKWHYGFIMNWQAGTAKNGVNDYIIRRNGVQIGTTTGLQFSDYGIVGDQSYQYSILTQEKTTNLLSAPANLKLGTNCDATIFGVTIKTFICSLTNG